jgi:hypothetical protein
MMITSDMKITAKSIVSHLGMRFTLHISHVGAKARELL